MSQEEPEKAARRKTVVGWSLPWGGGVGRRSKWYRKGAGEGKRQRGEAGEKLSSFVFV